MSSAVRSVLPLGAAAGQDLILDPPYGGTQFCIRLSLAFPFDQGRPAMKVTIFHSIARECASGSSPLIDVGTLPGHPLQLRQLQARTPARPGVHLDGRWNVVPDPDVGGPYSGGILPPGPPALDSKVAGGRVQSPKPLQGTGFFALLSLVPCSGLSNSGQTETFLPKSARQDLFRKAASQRARSPKNILSRRAKNFHASI